METGDNNGNKPIERESKPTADPGSSGNTSSTSTTTGKPRGRKPTAGGTGTGGTGTAETVENKKLSELPVVNDVPTPPKPKQTKKRKKTTKKNDSNITFSAEQITNIIVTISNIIGSREDMNMFIISEVEAKQIAVPLANLIEKSEKLNKITENADGIMLAISCGVIFIPRLIMYFDMKKEKKRSKKLNGNINTGNTEQKSDERPDKRNTTENNKQSTAPKSTNGNSLTSSIPSLAY